MSQAGGQMACLPSEQPYVHIGHGRRPINTPAAVVESSEALLQI